MKYSTVSIALAFAVACGGGEGEDHAEPAAETPPAAEPAAEPTAQLPPNAPDGVTAALISEGQGIFTGAGICLTCHGPTATGTALGPDLTDDAWLNTDGSFEGIVDVVTNGVAEPMEHPGIMAPRGGTQISDEQVRAVSAYVWSLSQG